MSNLPTQTPIHSTNVLCVSAKLLSVKQTVQKKDLGDQQGGDCFLFRVEGWSLWIQAGDHGKEGHLNWGNAETKVTATEMKFQKSVGPIQQDHKQCDKEDTQRAEGRVLGLCPQLLPASLPAGAVPAPISLHLLSACLLLSSPPALPACLLHVSPSPRYPCRHRLHHTHYAMSYTSVFYNL